MVMHDSTNYYAFVINQNEYNYSMRIKTLKYGKNITLGLIIKIN